MSERLAEVEARIGTVQQLSAVVTAMRGIAAARAREARRSLDSVRAYAGTVALAMARALACLPERRFQAASRGREAGGLAVIAIAAEQGFAGSFSEPLLDRAQQLRTDRGAKVLLIGDRGLMLARERGLSVDWSQPMASHLDHAPVLANEVMEALYQRLDRDRLDEVLLLYRDAPEDGGSHLVERRLLPFDYGRLPEAPPAEPPLLTLPPERLMARLVEEYVFATLCEAVVLAFSAENEARMRAMIAARSNVLRTLETLQGSARRLRQDAITTEIVELATGAEAAASA